MKVNRSEALPKYTQITINNSLLAPHIEGQVSVPNTRSQFSTSVVSQRVVSIPLGHVQSLYDCPTNQYKGADNSEITPKKESHGRLERQVQSSRTAL